MNNTSLSAQCMSGTTAGTQCTRRTNSPDGLCPQHRNAPLPLKTGLDKKFSKMPPPKVAAPDINDPEFHATNKLTQSLSGFSGSLSRGDYISAAVWTVLTGVASAQAYYEASQKFGWNLTKANRNLRHLNAALPSIFHEGGIAINKNFWDELENNKIEAQEDRSYLIEPTSNQHVRLTVSLQRSGLEEDSRNAKAAGNRKAAKIYKDFSKIVIGLLYEKDPAAAAEDYAVSLDDDSNLPTENKILINRFKIPYLQRAITQEQLEARRNVAARYRETAATLRGENETVEVFTPTKVELDVERTQKSSGTYYRLT